jgi:hypothetical protein
MSNWREEMCGGSHAGGGSWEREMSIAEKWMPLLLLLLFLDVGRGNVSDQMPVPQPMSAMRALGGTGMLGWRWHAVDVVQRKCWRSRRVAAMVLRLSG